MRIIVKWNGMFGGLVSKVIDETVLETNTHCYSTSVFDHTSSISTGEISW